MLKRIIDSIPRVLFFAMLAVSGGLFSVYGLNIADAQRAPISSKADLMTFLCTIISWMVAILLAIAVIMVLIAAFQYVTAGDNTERTSTARRTITYAAIGIVVALMAYGFPQIVASILPNQPSVSTFNCSPSGGVGSSSGGSSNLISV